MQTPHPVMLPAEGVFQTEGERGMPVVRNPGPMLLSGQPGFQMCPARQGNFPTRYPGTFLSVGELEQNM